MSYDGGIEQALEMARKRTLEDPSKEDRWESRMSGNFLLNPSKVPRHKIFFSLKTSPNDYMDL